jgi:hypothetical protein
MRLHEATFGFEQPPPLVFTSSVSGPQLADTAPVLRGRTRFATDADYRSYLNREQEAATIRGDNDLAAAAAKALATP